MFKLFIMYCLVIQPGYQLNAAYVIAGFHAKADCEVYARKLSADITLSKFYQNGTYECTKDAQ